MMLRNVLTLWSSCRKGCTFYHLRENRARASHIDVNCIDINKLLTKTVHRHSHEYQHGEESSFPEE